MAARSAAAFGGLTAAPAGLSPAQPRRFSFATSARSVLPPLLLFAAFIGAWQLIVTAAGIAPTVLPSPSRIVTSTWENRAGIAPAIWTTTQETLLGLLVAIVVGFLTAIVVDSSRAMSRSLYPLMIASQTLPIIALAPLIVIWFGFGIMPKVLLVALFSFFPIAVGLVQGLATSDPDTTNLLRTMRATRTQILWKSRLPHALPQFFTGLKISVTYCYSAAIVAEFVGAQQGLGVYMTSAENAAPTRTDLVFGAILVTSILTVALFALVSVLQRLAMPWRPKK